MMKRLNDRLNDHVSPTQIMVGIAIPVAVAVLTAFGSRLSASKLDTARFVADSITTHFEIKDTHRDILELRGLVLRVDSGVQEIRRTHR